MRDVEAWGGGVDGDGEGGVEWGSGGGVGGGVGVGCVGRSGGGGVLGEAGVAVVAGEGEVGLGSGDVREGRDVGVGERLGDGVGDAGGRVAGCEDADADVELGDEGEEGAIGPDATDFVEGVNELVGLVWILVRQL